MAKLKTKRIKVKPTPSQTDKEAAFVITIDDGFCKWQYRFSDNADDLSIQHFVNAICDGLGTKVLHQRILEQTKIIL